MAFQTCGSLRKLELREGYRLGDGAVFQFLGLLHQLESLIIERLETPNRHPLSEEQSQLLKPLTRLTALALSQFFIEEKAFKALESLTSLRRLTLHGCPPTTEALQADKQSFNSQFNPNLEITLAKGHTHFDQFLKNY